MTDYEPDLFEECEETRTGEFAPFALPASEVVDCPECGAELPYGDWIDGKCCAKDPWSASGPAAWRSWGIEERDR